ncbi:MAG: FAD-dependent oxidoreductase [Chromatiales bacterium]|nr:FAD-dependent oxidoreductase [Chromatiales bacterium]
MHSNSQLVIIGGGISGTALLYTAARYSGLKKITLLEKYDDLASVNSHARNNSQTLHRGDIETNYTLDKALYVKQAVDMVVNYAKSQKGAPLVHRYSKIALGVGEQEIDFIRKRFEQFAPHYPGMELFEASAIAAIEPNVALMADGRPRKEPIIAMGSRSEYVACDFAELSRSFVESALAEQGCDIELNLGTYVQKIEENSASGGFRIETNKGTIEAESVVACAGGHSLLMAHQMGYGKNYSVLPMGGSFYFTPNMLKGKVYTVQNDNLPFAAVHGDPDLGVEGKTRFGPTALALPMLERHQYKSIVDFIKVFRFDRDVMAVVINLLKVGDIRNYFLKNLLYEVPVLQRYLFMKEVQKIVPSLRFKDVRYANRFGGIRPQLIDKAQRKLILGEAKISPGNGIIFNMTPSPGATSCLQNAAKDVQSICEHLGVNFDKERHVDELAYDFTRSSSTAVHEEKV